VNLSLPAVFSVDDITPARNTIQQICECARTIEGGLATFSRDKLHGHVFNPAAGEEAILLVPVKSKHVPNNYRYVVGTDAAATATGMDASKGRWLRHPLEGAANNPAANEQAILRVLESWDEAFSYIQEDQANPFLSLRFLGVPKGNKRVDCSGRIIVLVERNYKNRTKELTYTNWKNCERRKGLTRKPQQDDSATRVCLRSPKKLTP
jgi:hypothetical protein